MEKQSVKSVTKSFRRLLIGAILFSSLGQILWGQTLTSAEINQLRIVPEENQSLFTKTDIKFQVVIPKVKPSQIQVMSNQLPDSVSFKTMRKIEDYENKGTRLEIWYSFDKKGTFQLSALPVTISGKRRNLKFEKITVTDDPAKQSPQFVIIFDNGKRLSSSDEPSSKPVFTAQTGKKIKFTVYLQYSTQLVQFNWEIPKDSIFTQTETYDITEVRYREKIYSHDLIPVAKFEWTGLKSGTQPVPKIRMTATAYNGYRNELLLPEAWIEFTETKAAATSGEDPLFDAAFKSTQNGKNDASTSLITEEKCQQLASLYSREMHSVFSYNSARKARISFENELGISSSSEANLSSGILMFSTLAAMVFLVFLLIALTKHQKIRILIFSTALICSLVPIIYSLTRLTHKFGICKGCPIYSVPEQKAEAVSEIGAGNKVQITEQTGKWCYIELGETGGWALKDNVIFIK